MKPLIRFIINPRSGTGSKKEFPEIFSANIDHNKFDFEICYTQYSTHAVELAREAVEKNYYCCVAVGGDGSVNEVGAGLVGSKTAMAIIPTGSGNGMARHLKIPVNVVKAIEVLNTGHIEMIDTLKINDRFCAGTIGVGFDAHIAHLFANAGKRGYSTYVKLVLTEFAGYREKKFSILADGNWREQKSFLLTFANSSQFGNNAVIAPFADVKDGVFDVSMISRFPLLAAPALIYRLMRNTIHHSSYFNGFQATEVLLKNDSSLPGHIDGEPVLFEGDLAIKINPLSLRVIVPFTS